MTRGISQPRAVPYFSLRAGAALAESDPAAAVQRSAARPLLSRQKSADGLRPACVL